MFTAIRKATRFDGTASRSDNRLTSLGTVVVKTLGEHKSRPVC